MRELGLGARIVGHTHGNNACYATQGANAMGGIFVANNRGYACLKKKKSTRLIQVRQC